MRAAMNGHIVPGGATSKMRGHAGRCKLT
jgi:hypothetical protein